MESESENNLWKLEMCHLSMEGDEIVVRKKTFILQIEKPLKEESKIGNSKILNRVNWSNRKNLKGGKNE